MSKVYYEIPQESPHPEKRFGHTITIVSKERAVVFGGAVGDSVYKITNDTFCYNSTLNKWITLKPKSQDEAPSPRAAHGATAVESNQMVIFGGAHSHGNMVDNELYLLKIGNTESLAKWVKVPVENAKPASRYGHAMVFFKPYILVIGGNIGNEPCNEVWSLSIDKSPFFWNKLDFKDVEPTARVYHTACIWRSASKVDMVLMFGGRNAKNLALNDMWGLRRHKNNVWDWVKAPIKNEQFVPIERYQHTMLCFNNLALLVGGRNNNNNDKLEIPMEIYNLETSEWFKFPGISRFRHVTWFYNNTLMTHGGFENSKPNQPTSILFATDMLSLFANFPDLLKNVERDSIERGVASEVDQYKGNDNGGQSRNRAKINTQIITVYMKDEQKGHIIQNVFIQDLPQEPLKLVEADVNLDPKQDDYIQNLYNTILKYFMKPFDWKYVEGAALPLKSQIITALCEEAIKVLINDPQVLKLKPGVKIFGSIHGQFGDMMRFFSEYGVPDTDPQFQKKSDIEALDYLFLGNYVDRGRNSLEVICTLLALKLKFPKQVFLLRGSHEDRKINFGAGLGLECETRLGEDITLPNSVFNKLNDVFEYMSYAAIIDDKIFCVHSGIGTTLKTVSEIEKIKKPFVINHDDNSKDQKIVSDVLWSDPVLNVNDFENKINETRDNMPNGTQIRFGINRINEFLTTNNLQIIVRSHESVPDGAEEFGNTHLYTVFSCTDYAGLHNNDAAIFHYHGNTKELLCRTLPYTKGLTKWYQQAQPKKADIAKKGTIGNDSGVEGKERPVTPLRRMTKNP